VRVLFAFVGGWGHAEPLVPLARAADGAGHVVAFAGQSALVPMVESLGFRMFATGPPTVGTTKQPLVPVDRAAEQQVLRDVFAGPIARGRAGDVVTLCGSWRPDLVVCDEVDFGAMVAAERYGVPHASVIVLAAGSLLCPALVAAPLDELRGDHGLAPDPGMEMLSRYLVLVPVPASFRDPAAPLPPNARFVRPAVLSAQPRPPAVPAAGSDDPIVYLTLGTIFNLESGDLFTRALAGLRALPLDVVVTVGPHIDPAELGPQPGTVHIEQFVPHADLLPRCGAVVCHGGSGSVIAALAHGVPLVLLPMGADQPDNADRCEALGVGIALDAMSATPVDVREAVRTVLTDPAYRRNAEALQEEIAALPGADHAVALLGELIDR
jgi:UDP:flavonoid glycosyltransferase YjiC (YdhE family)